MRLPPTSPCTGLIVLAALALTACGKPQPPEIKFAPYGAGFATKPDFARVEHEFPLVPADLAKLTPDNLKALTRNRSTRSTRGCTAGPIPDGPYDGGLFFPKGASGDKLRLAEIVGGLPGIVVAPQDGEARARRQASVAGQGLLPRRACAAQPHRGHGAPEDR